MRTILTGGTVVTPKAICEATQVVVENDLITDVRPSGGTFGVSIKRLDITGRYILPGLIDLHNDGIEKEVSPRPKVRFSPRWALSNYDHYLAGNGITTEFHALYFANIGGIRTLEDTVKLSHAISGVNVNDGYLINHRVLHRYEASRGQGIPEIIDCLAKAPVKLMSINNHTPGQGQYRQMKTPQEVAIALRGYIPKEAEHTLLERCAGDVLAENIERAARLAQENGVIIASHDDDSPEKVEAMYGAGASICEFPVTLEAAQKARELDMVISMGATNVMVGGSLSGNASAVTLIEKDLVDVMVSDYYAPALLASVFYLSRNGIMNLVDAVKMVSLNPAAAVGIDRRLGSVEAGKQADMVIVNVNREEPFVEAVMVNGEFRYVTAAFLNGRK